MPPICNIDAKGKFARLVWGFVLLLNATAVAVLWAVPAGGWVPWTAVGLIAAAGAFGIYEGWAGWCVMRAMGFKTPM